MYCQIGQLICGNEFFKKVFGEAAQVWESVEYSGDIYCVLALLALQEGNLIIALTRAQQTVTATQKWEDQTAESVALLILAQLYRLKREEEAYQTTLLKAQQWGDKWPLFSLIKAWIMASERQFIERSKKIAADAQKAIQEGTAFTSSEHIETKMARLSLCSPMLPFSKEEVSSLPSQEEIPFNEDYATSLSYLPLSTSKKESKEERDFDKKECLSSKEEENTANENTHNVSFRKSL